jgi:hypothetical protein
MDRRSAQRRATRVKSHHLRVTGSTAFALAAEPVTQGAIHTAVAGRQLRRRSLLAPRKDDSTPITPSTSAPGAGTTAASLTTNAPTGNP